MIMKWVFFFHWPSTAILSLLPRDRINLFAWNIKFPTSALSLACSFAHSLAPMNLNGEFSTRRQGALYRKRKKCVPRWFFARYFYFPRRLSALQSHLLLSQNDFYASFASRTISWQAARRCEMVYLSVGLRESTFGCLEIHCGNFLLSHPSALLHTVRLYTRAVIILIRGQYSLLNFSSTHSIILLEYARMIFVTQFLLINIAFAEFIYIKALFRFWPDWCEKNITKSCWKWG